ncbi:MAG: hypothetical protein K6C10_05660 [Prevotella sp.]|nr:hypothetical protein [Prevotella sp.]
MRSDHTKSIDRKTLVRRHNPQTHHVGTQQFLLGVGQRHMMVDATALQTFVPDRQNPISISLNLADTILTDLTMELDRWSGKASSHFTHHGQRFHVESVFMPEEPTPKFSIIEEPHHQVIAVRITSDSIFSVTLRPEPAAFQGKLKSRYIPSLRHHAVFNLRDDQGTHRYGITWRGNASLKKPDHQMVFLCKGDEVTIEGKTQKQYVLDIAIQQISGSSDSFLNEAIIFPFTSYALHVATGWSTFWSECGIADFSATSDPEALAVEAKLVETLYGLCANRPDDWWLQSPLLAYGFARQNLSLFTDKLQVSSNSAAAPNASDEVWKRPELIATALLTLRAFTLPQVVERHNMSDEKFKSVYTVLHQLLHPNVIKAAIHLESDHPAVPDYLNRSELLSVTARWQSIPDSLELMKPSDNRLFQLPVVSSSLPAPQFLFSIADSRWPAGWIVKTEDILPLP